MKKVRPHVFKIGDTVKVINPVFVTRVGYPLGLQEGIDQLITEDDKVTIKMLLSYKQPLATDIFSSYSVDNRKDKNFLAMLKILSYERISQQNFGGNERSLHTILIPELKNQLISIAHKKNVKTGNRSSVSGDYDSGGYTYLSNCKTHIILELCEWMIDDEIIYKKTLDGRLFIETINVEPV